MAREQQSNKHCQGMRSEDNPLSEIPVRLIIIGGKQVGKSALTVRYLTKRFIGEYQSHAGRI